MCYYHVHEVLFVANVNLNTKLTSIKSVPWIFQEFPQKTHKFNLIDPEVINPNTSIMLIFVWNIGVIADTIRRTPLGTNAFGARQHLKQE
jgi:hypothetical protein